MIHWRSGETTTRPAAQTLPGFASLAGVLFALLADPAAAATLPQAAAQAAVEHFGGMRWSQILGIGLVVALAAFFSCGGGDLDSDGGGDGGGGD